MTQPELFAECKGAPSYPPGPIVRAADVDQRTNCRFTLRRAWGPGPSILWCGANPSLANAERDDPTMRREIGFSYRWGFGSLVKVNLLPFITPNPAHLAARMRERRGRMLMHDNEQRLRDELDKVTVCVAAWGNLVPPDEVERILWAVRYDTADPKPVEWKCLGVTNSGAPKHTLARGKHRIPDDAKLIDWDFKFSDCKL